MEIKQVKLQLFDNWGKQFNLNANLDPKIGEWLTHKIESNTIFTGFENFSNYCFINSSIMSLFNLPKFLNLISKSKDDISKILFKTYLSMQTDKGSNQELVEKFYSINPRLPFFSKKSSPSFNHSLLAEGDPVEFLFLILEYTKANNLFLWSHDMGIGNEINTSVNNEKEMLELIHQKIDQRSVKGKYILFNIEVGSRVFLLPSFSINNSQFILSSFGMGSNPAVDGSVCHYFSVCRTTSIIDYRVYSDLNIQDVKIKQIYNSTQVRYIVYEYWGERSETSIIFNGMLPKKFINYTPEDSKNGENALRLNQLDGEYIDEEISDMEVMETIAKIKPFTEYIEEIINDPQDQYNHISEHIGNYESIDKDLPMIPYNNYINDDFLVLNSDTDDSASEISKDEDMASINTGVSDYDDDEIEYIDGYTDGYSSNFKPVNSLLLNLKSFKPKPLIDSFIPSLNNVYPSKPDFVEFKPFYKKKNQADTCLQFETMIGKNSRRTKPSKSIGHNIIESLKRNPLIPRKVLHPYIRAIIHYINMIKVQAIRNQWNYVESSLESTTYPLLLRPNVFTEIYRRNQIKTIENIRYSYAENKIHGLLERKKVNVKFQFNPMFDNLINQIENIGKV